MKRALLLVLALLALTAPAAAADTIVVNRGGTLDDPDHTNGTGPCETEADEGDCTLRAAIQTANRNPGKDTIAFDLDQILARIKPSTPLPAIVDPVLIDGWTAGGADAASGRQTVEVDGTDVPMPDPGSHGSNITVKAPYGLDVRAANSEIRGLAIHSFKSAQLALSSADSTLVQGNRIGLDSLGNAEGGAVVGVYVYQTIGATIGGIDAGTRNVISDNLNGMLITGARSIGNLVHGNYVGSSPDGLRVIGNDFNGILVTRNNAVGAADSTLVAGNLVVGHDSGVRVVGATDTKVFNNWFGLTYTGLARDAMGKSAGNTVGVDVLGAHNTLIGGAEEAWGNTIAAATKAGIVVTGTATDTHIETNFIGTDPTGTATVDLMGQPTGGAQAGIMVVSDSEGDAPTGVTIGGPEDTYANVSAGHTVGVAVLGGAKDVTLQRNLLGTDAPGNAALPNQMGVAVGTDDDHPETPVGVRVGTPGHGNVISGNTEGGVLVTEETEGVRVQGNKIGPGVDGRLLGNDAGGIAVRGSRTVVEENVIAGNGLGGIAVNSGARDVIVRANQVKDNEGPGVVVGPGGELDFQPERTTIEHNFVTGNAGDGVLLDGAVPGNVISDNAIGTNKRAGVRIDGTNGVLLDANRIEDNAQEGVHVSGETEDIFIGYHQDEQPQSGCVDRCNLIARNGSAGVAVEGTRPVAIRGNRFVDNKAAAIDVGTDGWDAIDAFDDDGILNPPAGVHGSRDPKHDEIAITGELAVGFDEDTKVDLYGLSDAPAAERGRSGTFIGTAFPDERGHFVLRTQQPYASYMGVAVDEQGHTSESSLVCSAHDGSSDQDDDALCDDWETDGIDYDADGYPDLALEAVDPGQPDVLVEADYTQGAFWGLGGDAAPSAATLRAVTHAFADAPNPINLQIELGEELERPEGRFKVAFRGEGDNDDLRDLRYGRDTRECDGAFGSEWQRDQRWCFATLGAKGLAYRYAVFTELLDSAGAGGAAAGDAFAVGVGHWGDESFLRLGGGRGTCVTVRVCRSAVEAAVLMHELGHALGLGHGRDQYAPNYLSVMNGSLTYPFVLPDRPLDFSRTVLPTLRETGLDEPAGIGGDGAEWPGTVRIGYDAESDTCAPVAIPVTGPVDWNGDGDRTDVGILLSVNEPDADPDTGLQDCQPPQAPVDEIEGTEDWSRLQFDQRTVTSHYDDHDEDAEGLGGDLARLTDVMDTDADGVSNEDDNCAAVANAGQQDEDADGIGDACLSRITERDVSLSVIADDPDPTVGRAFTLTATLRNEYPLPATGLRVRLPVPEGWTVESVAGDGYADGVWSVASLAKRSAAELKLKVVPAVEAERPLTAELLAADQNDPDSTPGNGADFEDDRVVLRFDPIPPEIVVGVADARVQEGNRADVRARVRLSLPRTWRRDVVVGWKTAADTAGDEDYAAGEGSVTIAAGERSAVIEVPVRGDRLVEPTERFTVALTVEGGRLERERATVFIADDDAPARPGRLDYLGCVSEDRGPLTECLNAAPGMREPAQLIAHPDERFMYLLEETSIVVVEHGATPVVRQCVMSNRVDDDCERLVPSWGVYIKAAEFSPDGKYLYVFTRHANTGHEPGIAVFARDAETGQLTRVACYEGLTGCAELPEIDQLDRYRAGGTELRVSDTQVLAISDVEPGEAGRLVTFQRSVDDGTLSVARCYDEGPQSAPPCAPLATSWGDDAEAVVHGPTWLVRSDAGLTVLARDLDGNLSPAACAACGRFTGPGDVLATEEAVYVTEAGRVSTLTPALEYAGCIDDAGLASDCPAHVEALAGLRGLALAPDGKDVYAGAQGGGVLALHRGGAGTLTGGECVIAETETSRCGDGDALGSFAFHGGEVWTAVDGVLARFVRFSVADQNRAPVCESGTAYTKPRVAVDVRLRCTDPDGDAVTVEVVAQPTLGTLTVNAEGAGRYEPRETRGEDTIRFRASDGRLWSADAGLTVKVDDLPPVCEDWRHEPRGRTIELQVRVACTDPEGGEVTYQLTEAPTAGTLSGWVFRYSAPASVETAFRYTGTDAGGNVSAPARVTLGVTYVPPEPAGGGGNNQPSTDRGPKPRCRSNCTPDRNGNVPVVITCPKDEGNACIGDVQICDAKGCRKLDKARTSAVLGKTKFKVQPGASRTVKVKLDKALRSKLKKQRKLKVQLVVTLRPPGAKPLVTTEKVTLRARR